MEFDDLDEVYEIFTESRHFYSKDGSEIELRIEPSRKFPHELVVKIEADDDEVEITSYPRNVEYDCDERAIRAAIKAAERKFDGYDYYGDDFEDLTVDYTIDLDDIDGDVNELKEVVDALLGELPEIWAFIFGELGLEEEDDDDDNGEFDTEEVRAALSDLPGFNQIDEEGDVEYHIKPSGPLKEELVLWAYVSDERVNLDCSSRWDLEGDCEEAVKAALAKYPDFDIQLNFSNDIRVRLRIEAADVDGSVDRLVDEVKKFIKAQPEIWAFIFNVLAEDEKSDEFDTDKVRAALKKLPGFDHVEDNGSVLFNIKPTAPLKDGLYMLTVVREDCLIFELAFSEIELKGDLDGAIEAAQAKYPGFRFVKNGVDEDILLRHRIEAADVDGNVDSLIDEIKKFIKAQPEIWTFILDKAAKELGQPMDRGLQPSSPSRRDSPPA